MGSVVVTFATLEHTICTKYSQSHFMKYTIRTSNKTLRGKRNNIVLIILEFGLVGFFCARVNTITAIHILMTVGHIFKFTPTNEQTHVHNTRSSLVVTHPSTNRSQRAFSESVTELSVVATANVWRNVFNTRGYLYIYIYIYINVFFSMKYFMKYFMFLLCFFKYFKNQLLR